MGWCPSCSLPSTLRLLNVVSGLGLILVGVFEMITSFSFTRSSIFSVYISFFGILLLGSHGLQLNFLLNNFGFFKSHAGTGLFLIFCGLLCLGKLWTFLIGIAICVAGSLEVVLHCFVKTDLKPELNAPLLNDDSPPPGAPTV